MSNDLAQMVRIRILAGGAWTHNLAACTNAVVCWLWCADHTAYQGGTAASGGNPNLIRAGGVAYAGPAAPGGQNGNFLTFLQPPGRQVKRTDLFLHHMAMNVGSRKRILTTFGLRQGMLVLWVDTRRPGRIAHAGVNGGGDMIYGYNQGGAYYKPQCGNPGSGHFHAQNLWCPRKASHINWDGYQIYTVSRDQAMSFFRRHHDDVAKW